MIVPHFNLSWSALNNFDRCPYLFYLFHIKKIALKEEYQNLPIRLGRYFSSLLLKADKEIYFSNYEIGNRELCKALCDKITTEKMLPSGLKLEQRFCHTVILDTVTLEHWDMSDWETSPPLFKGFLDAMGSDFFIEFKYTSRTDRYLNEWTALRQLEQYFFIAPENIVKGYMLPVTTPQARQGKEEGLDEFVERVKKDIDKRPGHYFPHYDSNKMPSWGLCFYRTEFEDRFEAFKKKLTWTISEIASCLKAHYFPQRGPMACYIPGECDFIDICSTGNINEEIYERRKWT